MSDGGKSSIRIDWFDGTLVEEVKPTSSQFADEEPEPVKSQKPAPTEKKPIGFKRLLDISLLKPPILTLEVANRPGFWNLFDQEDLKGDFIVLIVRILAGVHKDVQPGDNSKISKLLKTRFLSSDFLDKIINYLRDLPNVRVVEKRMNAQLWDDVEGFFNQILDLCDGIIHLSEINNELSLKLDELLETLLMSAIGVIEEHSERFSDKLFERIKMLKSEVEVNGEWDKPTSTPHDPNSFKNLNIFPTRQDLTTTAHIQANIVNGTYPSIESYLDLQFKLLREDCFGPLRDGICKYLQNPSKRRHENIRVYPQVRVLRTYISNNKVGHLIDLAWKERLNGLDVKKQYNKQLMFGSLLLFTSDNFETILCATVLDSSMNLLREGYLVVSFQNPVSKNILNESYLMVESEVFFEPYHQVLKVLQASRLDELPMKKYIVDVMPETLPPSYLTSETLYTIQMPDKTEIPFPVLDTDQYPKKELDLDESQLEAFKFALTREFAVIQGPPGTGKTFLGVKIACTLLKNVSLEGTPMLIICYTNHALDQFLEGVLGVTNSVVRLGSQSKSKKLEPYNLNALRSKIKCKYSYLYASKRAELENIYKVMVDIQTEVEKCEQGILNYKCIKPHLKIEGKQYDLNYSDGDRVLNWLFEHLEGTKENKIEEDSWENIEDLELTDKIETCFTEKWALNEIESLRNIIKHVNVNKDAFSNANTVVKFEEEIARIKRRLECFKSKMLLLKNNKEEYKFNNIKDLHSLETEQRWSLYFEIVRRIKNELLTKMDALLEKHNTVNEELTEVSTLIDGEVMSNTRVVGVTTTAGARRHLLVKRLMSSVVIVEEAAEVLETHIVASLTNKCQHLILIGDHKQLRPTASHYKLAKHYNLEISLFERMITNGIHAKTLTTQRRMRPKFVELLVPTIYEKLNSHNIVYGYKNVRGMKDDLFFFCHEVFEDSEWDNGELVESGITNGIHAKTLTTQRRMRPNFVELLVPTIYYEKLDSHNIVYGYENVRGMKDDLFFFCHEVFEDSEGMEDSWSHKNTLEAKWCVSLANYLRKMKYNSEDITILSTYNGQVTLIKKLSQKYDLLRDIKITAVDNFQGEESRIVILSLVRSNRDGKIGFLSAANRICVALSRAKEGFYMFGNMNVLKNASPIWRAISEKLTKQNAIGNKITLLCDTKENIVKTPEELDNIRC